MIISKMYDQFDIKSTTIKMYKKYMIIKSAPLIPASSSEGGGVANGEGGGEGGNGGAPVRIE